MARVDSFIDDFQKDHLELLNLVNSFQGAIESSDCYEAKNILTKIDDLANRHFDFEENYLYPRLRRLVLEITENLRREQETVREFIDKSRRALEKNSLHKFELSDLLKTSPRLSKFFEECDDLASLAEKFSEEDKEDLKRRFKEVKIRPRHS
ncbi:MAG: hemerythrin domain-containing protein [Candidatus Omnitrophota bacterium]|jgi:hemerythrin